MPDRPRLPPASPDALKLSFVFVPEGAGAADLAGGPGWVRIPAQLRMRGAAAAPPSATPGSSVPAPDLTEEPKLPPGEAGG